MNMFKMIGVIGGNDCSAEDASAAEAVGRLIAAGGGTVVCGGGGGIMTAVCRGAVDAGGQTIGILPGEDPAAANPFVTCPIVTGMGIGRNIIIVRTVPVLIAIAGRFGTLSEIAYALQLGKPVFSLRSWDHIEGVRPLGTPAEAVAAAFRELEARAS